MYLRFVLPFVNIMFGFQQQTMQAICQF